MKTSDWQQQEKIQMARIEYMQKVWGKDRDLIAEGFKDQESKLPFVNIYSLSSNKKFRLFIEPEIVDQVEVGEV